MQFKRDVLGSCATQASTAVRALASSAGASEQQGSEYSRAHLLAAAGGVLAGVFGASVVASANEVADGMHSPSYPWPHEGPFDSFDHASIRRGHQVYQQVRLSSWQGHAGSARPPPRVCASSADFHSVSVHLLLRRFAQRATACSTFTGVS